MDGDSADSLNGNKPIFAMSKICSFVCSEWLHNVDTGSLENGHRIVARDLVQLLPQQLLLRDTHFRVRPKNIAQCLTYFTNGRVRTDGIDNEGHGVRGRSIAIGDC